MQRPRLLLLVLAVAGVAVASVFGGIGTAAPAATAVPQVAAASQARPTLTVRNSSFGRILFDGRGFALYAFTADGGGRSRCSGDCAKAWPPYILKGSLRAGSGVRPGLLGTIRRADGRRQVTYKGRPLYYYVGDRRVGQVLCQNVFEFGGLWLVVRPSGRLVR